MYQICVHWLNFGKREMFLPKSPQDMHKVCAPSVRLTKVSFFEVTVNVKMSHPKCSQDMRKICAPSVHLAKI